MKKQPKQKLALNQIDDAHIISDADKMRIKGGGGDIIIVIDIIECPPIPGNPPPVVTPLTSSIKRP